MVRQGIVLETNFTAPVNVELQVGSLEETVTVTGESPAWRRCRLWRHVDRAHDQPELPGRGSQRPALLRSVGVRHPAAHQLQVAGSFPLRWGVIVSGTFSNTPGSERGIAYQVTRTLVPTLTQTSVNVRLNEPGTEFNDTVTQLNLTVAKSFRRGNIDIRPEVAAFNALNANPVLSQVNTYGPSLGRVNAILNPRLVRLGLAVKF